MTRERRRRKSLSGGCERKAGNEVWSKFLFSASELALALIVGCDRKLNFRLSNVQIISNVVYLKCKDRKKEYQFLQKRESLHRLLQRGN